jgi:hypothetical protein
MTKYAVSPTGRESSFGVEEIIVSKTHTTGRITYANDVFLRGAQGPHPNLPEPDPRRLTAAAAAKTSRRRRRNGNPFRRSRVCARRAGGPAFADG